MIIMIQIICILLIFCLISQEVIHMKEKQDLLNRIMAKDYTELKVFESKPKPKKEEEKPKEPDFL